MKKSFVLLVSSLALMSTLHLAHAGNGGGANGPDLNGDAMPIQLDREVDEGFLNKVTEKCIKPTLDQLWIQVFGNPNLPKNQYFYRGSPSASYSGVFFIHLYQKSENSLGYGSKISSISVFPDSMVIAKEEKENFTGEARVVRLSPKEGALKTPYFIYDLVNVDFVYDDLGIELSHRTVARNIKLVHGNDPSINARFVNQKTKADTKIILDLKDYRDCLVTELQN